LGIRSIVQLVPFHRTASLLPSAVHAVADGQDTAPMSPISGVCWGGGRLNHLAPFQRSIKGPFGHRPLQLCPLSQDPTAAHAVADEHDTSLRDTSTADRGSGIRCNDQRRPFQRWISAEEMQTSLAHWLSAPTVTHIVAEAHETSLGTMRLRGSGL
jgi:hypothetical protein